MADWVIVVDDDVKNLKIAGSILSRNGIRVTALKSGSLFLDYIKDNGMPDVVLLDIFMPQMDGFETLSRLREYEKEISAAPVPVIFLTADDDASSEVRGFQMGVSDYIHKPFDPEIFTGRVINIIASKKRIQKIENKATHDLLTGLYNKEASKTQISAMCLRETGMLCMIDLDSFKLVNDIYGHEMGDRILVSFAEIIRGNMTPGSIAGRIGGDEFLMFGMMMSRDDDIAEFTFNLNSELLKAACSMMGDQMQIPLGVSVGCVNVPEHGTDYDELFKMADKALYSVKENGKHGYSVYGTQSEGAGKDDDVATDLKTLSKMLEERTVSQSAMWMGREAFGNVYRYMMRYLERYDVSAYKVMFSLKFTDPSITDEKREDVTDSFREIIQNTLRNSDIMVRMGACRFFLLMPEINSENIDHVIARMEKAWKDSAYGPQADMEKEYELISSDNDQNGKKSVKKPSGTIVVVDDDAANRMVAEHILNNEGMKTVTFASGYDLLDYVKTEDPSLILLDINMPGIDGFETMNRLKAVNGRSSGIPVVFLTASDDDETETKGFAMGAVDFIRKPFVPEIFVTRVRHAINLITLQNHLKSEVSEKVEENEKLSMHIIQALASAVDAKDKYTSGHSGRVAEYSKQISARMGYDTEAQNTIYMMALLHDVGKIAISDNIINKERALDDDEYEIIKTHPVRGADILGKISEMPELVTGARWHHERYDGTGYPDGLKGEEIPEQARIIAVADSYDAMTSRRAYRAALPQSKVRMELVNGRGTQFDPGIADVMIMMIDEDVEFKMKES